MNWHSKSAFETAEHFKVEVSKGLSSSEAKNRILEFGENKLCDQKHKSLLVKFIEQLSDFLVLILLAAAVISFFTSFLRGENDFIDPIIILAIVFLNAVMGVIQENKAERAIDALKKLAAPHARVKRDGTVIIIKSTEVVPGDVLLLEEGDYIPADARLVEAINMKTEESSLTGESLPVEKDAQATLLVNATVGDRKNMLLATTLVTAGRAVAIATETGMNTEVGKIANMINEDETRQTPLQNKLKHTGKVLGIAAIVICTCIFFLGFFEGQPPFEMFMIAVSLAVAAIPEGLPAIVTIILALGVQRMVKSNAILRKLPAVETLGGATVICSDKTGTLTQNKMTVTEIASHNGFIGFHSATAKRILSFGSLCNNSNSSFKGGKEVFEGDPTETAIVIAANKYGIKKNMLDTEFRRVAEIPFDSARKLMTTIHKLEDGKYRIIVKGAPDVLLRKCCKYEDNENGLPINNAVIETITKQNEIMAAKALRVIAVAYKTLDSLPSKILPQTTEMDLTFVGLIGMMDPPRPEVKDAVRLCHHAGIKTVMITGDHAITAAAIAKELCISKAGDKIMTGEELDKLSQHELEIIIIKCSVFARVTPAHKLRVVKAFQARGEIVAMTGDGVNDAPSLKQADIGCAMGISGTDVAKNSADMILTDDNFTTIVDAVREGRGIFLNIRKTIHFLLSSNVGEIITIFTAFLIGIPSPLVPIQLLWVNLVTDSLPALALGVEKIDTDVMDRKPINSKKGFFSEGLGVHIALEGMMIGALALLAFSIGRIFFDFGGTPTVGRTMAFCVLSLSQLVHAFNTRSSRSLFKIGFTTNKPMLISFFICTLMQVAVVSIPAISTIFKTTPLNFLQWQIVAFLSLLPLLVMEIQKAFNRDKI